MSLRGALVLLLAWAAAGGCGGAGDGREPFPDGAADRVPRTQTSPPLGTAVPWTVAQHDAELRRAVERGFTSVTPENELKFEAVEPERGKFAFALADAFVDWATGAGKRIRGHTLIWHQQVPAWLGEQRWQAGELRRVLDTHVRTVVGRYRGRIETWDVVNEPFTDAGRWRTDAGSPWLAVLGPGYVADALKAARAADPAARLFVNEIGAEHGGPKLDALARLVRDLKADGVPLDGIGLEAHLNVDEAPSRRALQRSIERLAALDVDVELTELDVEAGRAADRARQAGVYGDAAAACAAVARCTRVTVWGVSDRDSWLGVDQRAAPFDADLRPKPAWAALTGALNR